MLYAFIGFNCCKVTPRQFHITWGYRTLYYTVPLKGGRRSDLPDILCPRYKVSQTKKLIVFRVDLSQFSPTKTKSQTKTKVWEIRSASTLRDNETVSKHQNRPSVVALTFMNLDVKNFFSGVVTDQGCEQTCWAHTIAHVILQVQRKTPEEIEASIEGTIDNLVEICQADRDKPQYLSKGLACAQRKYGVQWKWVDVEGAQQSIREGHYVVAGIALDQYQWQDFHKFFAEKPNGILGPHDLSLPNPDPNVKVFGHAVALIATHAEHGEDEPSCFEFKNSGGEKWAGNGKFKIGYHAIFNGFIPMELIEVKNPECCIDMLN